MQRRSIVVFDDDIECRSLLERYIESAGHRTEVVPRAADLAGHLDQTRHAAAIAALSTGQAERLRLVNEISRRAPAIPLLVVVDHDEAEEAVEAMKVGAYDFIGKPFNRDHLLLAVGKALERKQLQDEVRALRIKTGGVERGMVYVSRAVGDLVDTADRVAQSEASVLISGESGTGKELIARRIHVRSERAESPFVAINCAAMPAELLESELFGHEKGAFTGATRSRAGKFRQADGGTLFLDEIGELPLPLQSKLLRVLQERVVDVIGRDKPVPVDVRLVAATNKDLPERVSQGEFREDLYYRLNVVELRVPPLREREEDIPPLVDHFVERFAEGRDLLVPDSLLAAMRDRPWPGNVRELENACERLVILAKGDTLSEADLPRQVGHRGEADPSPEKEEPVEASLEEWPALPPDGLSLIELERTVIERVLELKQWNISQAARYLRIPRHILTYRMEKYGLRRPQ